MNFRIGQKVVCVDAECIDGLVEGNIYEILWIGPVGERDGCFKGQIMSPDESVVEIEVYDTLRWKYAACRFRPLVSKSTSIEWAHRIDRNVFGGVDA